MASTRPLPGGPRRRGVRKCRWSASRPYGGGFVERGGDRHRRATATSQSSAAGRGSASVAARPSATASSRTEGICEARRLRGARSAACPSLCTVGRRARSHRLGRRVPARAAALSVDPTRVSASSRLGWGTPGRSSTRRSLLSETEAAEPRWESHPRAFPSSFQRPTSARAPAADVRGRRRPSSVQTARPSASPCRAPPRTRRAIRPARASSAAELPRRAAWREFSWGG